MPENCVRSWYSPAAAPPTATPFSSLPPPSLPHLPMPSSPSPSRPSMFMNTPVAVVDATVTPPGGPVLSGRLAANESSPQCVHPPPFPSASASRVLGASAACTSAALASSVCSTHSSASGSSSSALVREASVSSMCTPTSCAASSMATPTPASISPALHPLFSIGLPPDFEFNPELKALASIAWGSGADVSSDEGDVHSTPAAAAAAAGGMYATATSAARLPAVCLPTPLRRSSSSVGSIGSAGDARSAASPMRQLSGGSGGSGGGGSASGAGGKAKVCARHVAARSRQLSADPIMSVRTEMARERALRHDTDIAMPPAGAMSPRLLPSSPSSDVSARASPNARHHTRVDAEVAEVSMFMALWKPGVD